MTMKTKKTQRIKKDYFNWLFQRVADRSASKLDDFLYDLYSADFYCLIPNDDNRAIDGLKLRDKFIDELDYDLPSDAISGQCSVLEMLIALADRMDFILFDPPKGTRRSMWFWMFIDNLKLKKYDRDDEDAEKKRKVNKIIIRKFVKREYQFDGRGGIFPLNDAKEDQRNVEIWYQMMDYIAENYEV